MVFTKFYENLPVNRKEVLRYAGCKDGEAVFGKLLDECVAESVAKGLSLKVCYTVFDVEIRKNVCGFGAFSVKSENLAKNLQGCTRAVVFAATAGVEIDRLIAKYGALSPSKAVMFQSLGAERVEALCDAFCEDVRREMNCETKPRFSPGYGDLDLSSQKDIFSVLGCEKHIGLTLNDSMLMSPSKSVTAIMGIIG